MQRVDTLINKIKEQRLNNEAPAALIATVQLLLSALQEENYSTPKSNHVSVVMPFNFAVAQSPSATSELQSTNDKNTAFINESDLFQTPTFLNNQNKSDAILNAKTNSDISLNEKLKSEKIELAATLQQAPIKDLRKAIGINDRYLFVNNLFNGDERLFEKSIKTINGFAMFAEADFWIEKELKQQLNWQDESEAVLSFYALVKRRFS